VIESPLFVRRVAPPTITMVKTKIESQNNHLLIAGMAVLDRDALMGSATSLSVSSAMLVMAQN
jgi:hypothetical protein